MGDAVVASRDFFFFEGRRNLPNRTSDPNAPAAHHQSATIYPSIQFHRGSGSRRCRPRPDRTRTLPLAPLLTRFRVTEATHRDPLHRFASDRISRQCDGRSTRGRACSQTARDSLPILFHSEVSPAACVHPPALNHLLRGRSDSARVGACVTPGKCISSRRVGAWVRSAIWSARNFERVPVCVRPRSWLAPFRLIREIYPDARQIHTVSRGFESIRHDRPDLVPAQLGRSRTRVTMTRAECPRRVGTFAFGVGRRHGNASSNQFAKSEHEFRCARASAPTTQDQATALGSFRPRRKPGPHRARSRPSGGYPDSRWEAALPALDDAYSLALPESDRAKLWCEIATVLRTVPRSPVWNSRMCCGVPRLDQPAPFRR